MWEEGVRIYDTPGVPNNFPFYNYVNTTKTGPTSSFYYYIQKINKNR